MSAKTEDSPAHAGRALMATVVVVGPPDRVEDAAEAIEQLGQTGGARTIVISEGDRGEPAMHASGNTVTISGLAPRFFNNAVAGQRLSSLPAVVWWRGGSVEPLDDLAGLADRLILDAAEPEPSWDCADRLFETSAVSDLRWTALTRWRAALAHLFDLPTLRQAAPVVTALEIEARDVPSARLFAGWLKSCLRWTPDAPVTIKKVSRRLPTPLASVRVSLDGLSIVVELAESRTCLHAGVGDDVATTRVVPLGEGGLSSLVAEELCVRTRDVAFERALVAARGIAV